MSLNLRNPKILFGTVLAGVVVVVAVAWVALVGPERSKATKLNDQIASVETQIDQRNLIADEKDPALVRLSLISEIAPGTYKVTWSAVAQDLHVSKGSFSFKVQP